jgi:hypothetical protein
MLLASRVAAARSANAAAGIQPWLFSAATDVCPGAEAGSAERVAAGG